jgi:hypothetical protein
MLSPIVIDSQNGWLLCLLWWNEKQNPPLLQFALFSVIIDFCSRLRFCSVGRYGPTAILYCTVRGMVIHWYACILRNQIRKLAPHCNLIPIGQYSCGWEEWSWHIQQAVSAIVARNGLAIHRGKRVDIQTLVLVLVGSYGVLTILDGA